MTDWNALVVEHRTALWRTAYRLLNHYDDALDCCQDAFLDAYRYASEHGVNEWGAILTCLVTRRAIDRLRQRVKSRHLVVSLDGVAEPSTSRQCPVENAAAMEVFERLRNLLAELPEKQAAVFWLSNSERLSHEQISEQLRITMNESRVLLHRARAYLENALQLQRTHTGHEK